MCQQINANPNASPEIGRLTYNAIQWALNGGSLQTDRNYQRCAGMPMRVPGLLA